MAAAQSEEAKNYPQKILGVFCSKMPIRTNEINNCFEYKWIFLFVAQKSFIGTTIVMHYLSIFFVPDESSFSFPTGVLYLFMHSNNKKKSSQASFWLTYQEKLTKFKVKSDCRHLKKGP